MSDERGDLAPAGASKVDPETPGTARAGRRGSFASAAA